MEQVWRWGIDVIIIVQKIRAPFIDTFFIFISALGTQFFYMLLLPFLYWCYDKKTGSKIFILFIISGWMNSVFKDLINHPRPYAMDETLKIDNTGGPGLPSGHAQQSLVFWGSLSLKMMNSYFTCFSVVLILLIALSRIYLGVHFPTDILGGWFLGGFILIVMWPLYDRAESYCRKSGTAVSASAALIVPVLLSMIMASKWSVMSMGSLSGFCTGLLIERKYINFEPAVDLKSGFYRYVSGGVMLIIVFSAGKLLFSKSTPHYLIIIFIHSWLMSIMISALIPWLFKKYRI